jgi:hypothetical protein
MTDNIVPKHRRLLQLVTAGLFACCVVLALWASGWDIISATLFIAMLFSGTVLDNRRLTKVLVVAVIVNATLRLLMMAL